MTDSVKFIIEADGRKAEATLDGLAASVDKTGNSAKRTSSDFRRLDKDGASAGNAINKAFVRATKAVVGVAAVAAAGKAFTYVAGTAKEFEKSISDLSAITGATGQDLDFLSSKALEFGATTTLSASQAAEAFKLVASAKPDLLANRDALAAVTREAITLSEAAGVSLSDAAKTLGSSLNQFNADASESTRFINTLAAGAKFGASEIDQTAQALKVAGTVASSAGLSFEQTNAAIQALATVSIKGSEAGTGLRGVLLKLSTQTNKQFNPEVVGFTQAIQNLASANLSTTEKTKLFGQESITAANALIQQADSLDTLTGKLTGTNTAYDQASVRTNNLDGDIKALNSAIEAQAILAGNTLTPALRVLTQGFTEVISVSGDTQTALNDSKAAGEQVAVVIGQVADVAGNAAKGIALPFQVVGDAIGGVAAQLSFIAEGDFAKARDAGVAAVDSMKQRLDNLTDPKTVTRYEDIARGIVASNKEIAKSSAEIQKPAITAAKPGGAAGSSVAARAQPSIGAGKSAVDKAKANAERELAIQQKKYAALSALADTFYASDQQKEDQAFRNKVKTENEQFNKLYENEALSDAQRAQLKADHQTALMNLQLEHGRKTAEIMRKQVEEQRSIQQQRREEELQNTRDYYQASLDLQSSFSAALSTNQQVNIDNMVKQMLAFAATAKKIDKTTWQGRVEITRGALTAASSLMESHNRKAFEVGKVAAIANATVATIQGATEALKYGPIIGPVLAGIVTAAGAANIAKIASTQLGGGGGGGAAKGLGGNASPGAVGAAPPPQPVSIAPPQPTQAQQAAGATINVQVTALDPAGVKTADLQRIGDALSPILQQNLQNSTNMAVTV